jgi:BON domain
MRLSLLYVPVLLLATLGFSQQQAQPPPASPPYTTPPTFPEEPQMPPDQKAPPPQVLSTTQVEQQIQRHFNAEPALANTNLGIKANESLVVLSGTVDSDMQHELALRIAQSYAGNRKIVDKINVRQQT